MLYSRKVAIQWLNFAFGEHYKGEYGNKSLIGLLTASLNFTYFDQLLANNVK